MAEWLTIGQLAQRAGVRVSTIRYYERWGLLPLPPRSDSGYRLYPPETVELVAFIKRAKSLGFSLQEVRELLSLRLSGGSARHELRRRAEAKMREIEEKIRTLDALRRSLEELIRACEEGGCGCPILRALEGETPAGEKEVPSREENRDLQRGMPYM